MRCLIREMAQVTKDSAPDKATEIIHRSQCDVEAVQPLLEFTVQPHVIGVGRGGGARPVCTQDLDRALGARKKDAKKDPQMGGVVDHPYTSGSPAWGEKCYLSPH